jgi:hypothetical protein
MHHSLLEDLATACDDADKLRLARGTPLLLHPLFIGIGPEYQLQLFCGRGKRELVAFPLRRFETVFSVERRRAGCVQGRRPTTLDLQNDSAPDASELCTVHTSLIILLVSVVSQVQRQ